MMKNECKKIEPLLYLHRKNELLEEERLALTDHLENCSSCCAVIQQLQSMDSALEPLRNTISKSYASENVVRQTLESIVPERNRTQKERIAWIYEFPGWLRPVLTVVLVAIVTAFTAQQFRDAYKIMVLEQRLQKEGNVFITSNSFIHRNALHTADLEPLQHAIITGNLLNIITAEYPKLFRNKSELFDEFASRYPHLSHITLKDGIDKNEKEILSTEGKAFLKEFEHLIQEGE
jgi:hypothetical protein